MNNPVHTRKLCAFALILQLNLVPSFAQPQSKKTPIPETTQHWNVGEPSSGRSLELASLSDSSEEQGGETGARVGTPRLVVQLGHSGQVDGMSMSRDGRMVVTAGDTTARLWDVETGKEIRSFQGHS